MYFPLRYKTHKIIYMKKILFHITLFLLCLISETTKAEIRAALIVPQSGNYKLWGNELAEGASAAINEINKNGGIQGKRLTLEIIDDPCNENLSVSTAQMLSVSREKPAFIIGPYCSSGFAKTASIFADAKIFQIVPMILSADNAAKNYDGLIKISGIKEQIGLDFFNFYNKKAAGEHIAVIYDPNNSETEKQALSVSEQFRRHGKISLLHTYTLEHNSKQLATDIAQRNENVILLLGQSKKIIKTIRHILNKNDKALIITEKYMIGDELQNLTDANFDHIFFMGLPQFETNPDFAELIVKLRLKNIELSGLNIYGYIAVQTWADLVKETGSYKYEDISKTAQQQLRHNLWSNASTQQEQMIHYVFYKYNNEEFTPFDE